MTKEEKAKAYDKALQRTRRFYDSNTNEGYRAIFEDIFPELKESEDERIKKELIFYLRYQHSISENFEDIGKWIAWLEKQGEQKKSYDVCDSSMMDNKKSPYGEKRDFGYFEEKPADKVEPKFKVGDWIANKSHDICLITEIDLENSYYICESNRFGNTYGDIDLTDKAFHLWTIEDAKDGDVLVCGVDEKPFIFKCLLDPHHPNDPVAYCGIDPEGYFCVSIGNYWWTSADDNIKPANKEQRDLLFSKMNEAGYEWDAENKESNKIKQKTTDKVEPKFKVGDWIVYNRDDHSREIMQVYDIRDGRYYFTDNVHFSWSIKECDEKSHLWTIQDAKDGDVLAGDKRDVILMFRGIGNREWDDVIDYYCYYDCYHEDFIVQEDVNYWGNIDNNQLKPATKEQRDLLFSKMKEAGYELDAENKESNKIEQKPINKVESGFKIGDWIVNNVSKDIFLITSVNSGYCSLEDTKGNIYVPCLPFESDFHLWTIQDVKDGDIIAEDPIDTYPSPFVAIYKKQNEKHFYTFDSHCFIGFNGNFYEGEEGHNIEDIHPATKEQRDTLMKAMADAGWEFDFEKKELKKIHNALEECEIEHIEHGKYYYCIKDYYSGGCKRASKGEVVQALRGKSMMALGVEANKYFIPVKRIVGIKPAWSEADTEILSMLIELVEYKEESMEVKVELIDWLKSLKDRIGE